MQSILPSSLFRFRLPIIILLHALFAGASLYFAFLLRFEFTLSNPIYLHMFLLSLPANIAAFMLSGLLFNVYQGMWRYVSVNDLQDIVKTSVAASLLLIVFVLFSGWFSGYPRSVYVINGILFIVFAGGARLGIRIFREAFAPQSENVRNVLIVGAGQVGNNIARTLKAAKRKTYIPVGFIDDDPKLHGQRIQGIKVLGDLSQIKHYIRKLRIHEVFIAIPEATNKLVNDIIDAAKIPDWDVKFKIVPSMLDIMSGKLQITQVRDVEIDDLLSRPNITLDDTHVRKQLAAKTIMVTGAGGSIGSEISYQVAAYRPARLILLDSSEENAYHIDKELKKRHPDVAIHTIVGSILDNSFLKILFNNFSPDYIFHAAAYKHVHLMEWNPLACFKNNILGTANLAALAELNGVKEFVMISTDKAVNPRGIMGLSKRLAERVVLERENSGTLFNVVRFGNVFGSSGSVIPLFQQQIRDGGPVTVTSPNARRFFMSIPEAAQLVLQASTLNESNAIFMLDMGEPVKIIDLAAKLIQLSGFKVGQDIDIKFTGMRPGEKIEEELLSAQENLIATQFKKIRLQRNVNYAPEAVEQFVHRLKSDVELGNLKTIYADIQKLVPELTGPSFEEMMHNMFS
jgi:FlaA1/EpsC-like NDP-sugar epimerase